MTAGRKIVHIETIDLDHQRPGGVESLIRDLLLFAPGSTELIGIGIHRSNSLKNPRVLSKELSTSGPTV
jgi:hypothetical protein